MNSKLVIESINKTIKEIKIYIEKYKINPKRFEIDIKVLEYIKTNILEGNLPSERVLRGFKDICTNIAINYEDSDFNDSIFLIYNEFENKIDKFGGLNLLGTDFGKEEPI